MLELILFIIAELALLFFVGLVYIKAPRNQTNLFFVKFYLISVLWSIVNYLENEFVNIAIGTLFLKLDFAVAPLILYYYLLFCLNFPVPVEINLRKRLTILLPVCILSLLSFSFWVVMYQYF